MNLGREIVAHVLRTKQLKPFLEADLTLEWLSRQDDFSSDAIFGERDEDAYRFVLRHYEEHRKTPSLDFFERAFPAETYRLPDSDYTAHELVSLAKEDIQEFHLGQAGSEFIDLYDAGKLDEATAVLERTARKIRDSRTSRSIVTFWDDPETDIEAKIHRVVTKGIRTGIPELDDTFPGFQRSNLITYLGRAKAGKTSFLLRSALDSWERTDGKRVLFITVEMSQDEISDRLDCHGAGISLERYQQGKLTSGEERRLRKFRGEMEEYDPTFRLVQTLGKYTLDDLEDDIDRYKPDVVYIDGFHFLIDRVTGKPGAHWEGHDNISAELRTICMRTGLVICVSMQVREKQLKRGEMSDAAMMGGTGLNMASDMVLGFNIDKETQTHTIDCLTSRTRYLRTVKGKWDWEVAKFTPVEDDEKEYSSADTSY